jgi:hypothetical protein
MENARRASTPSRYSPLPQITKPEAMTAEMFASNQRSLKKIERRLNKKVVESNLKKDVREIVLAELNVRMLKKKNKNWRFPYDMYCKQIITGKD